MLVIVMCQLGIVQNYVYEFWWNDLYNDWGLFFLFFFWGVNFIVYTIVYFWLCLQFINFIYLEILMFDSHSLTKYGASYWELLAGEIKYFTCGVLAEKPSSCMLRCWFYCV